MMGYGVAIIPMLLLFSLAILGVYSIVWAVRDAERRGKSPVLVGLLVFLIQPWPLGLVLWLVFRPDYKSAH